LTGVLGLAIIYGIRHARGIAAPKPPSSSSTPGGPSTSQASRDAQTQQQQQDNNNNNSSRTFVTKLTISLGGVVITETSTNQLEEGATLIPGAAEALSTLRYAGTDIYLLAQVASDIGETVVRGALEHGGILGTTAPNQIPPHKLLCCDTLDGKVSLVRQLEPGLHVDGHPATIHALQRFVGRLALIHDNHHDDGSNDKEKGGGVVAAPNIRVARSLSEALGL
jgi:hypothetical protein